MHENFPDGIKPYLVPAPFSPRIQRRNYTLVEYTLFLGFGHQLFRYWKTFGSCALVQKPRRPVGAKPGNR